MRARAARTATCALDVEVRWGDGELLASEHLRGSARYLLVSASLPAHEPGYVVQSDWLGLSMPAAATVAPWVLAQLHDEQATVQHVGGTAQTLRLGEQTLVHVGPLVFRVAVVPPRAEAAGALGSLRVRDHTWTLASLGLHTLALGCMMLLPPKASSLSLDAMSEDPRYARYLTTPVLREHELPPSFQANDASASSDSSAHAGEEGAAGKPTEPAHDRRLAVSGRADERVLSKKPTASDVRASSLLGALSTAGLKLSPSSPFGADTPVGDDPVSALSALFGSTVGDTLGAGGLGMKHAGRGGGGDALGTVGVGELGTRDGARRGLGVQGALNGRTARVPVLRSEPAEIRGALSKEAIRRAIHLRLNELRHCYERGLAADPELSGRVAVSFLIAPSGAVQQAMLKESTLSSRAVAECVTQAVRRFSFPAPDGGGYVQVTYPFSFSAQ